MDLSRVAWRKSSYSGGNGGNCVEVGAWRKNSHSGVAVRDSKNPVGPALAFTHSEWEAFVKRFKDSALDG